MKKSTLLKRLAQQNQTMQFSVKEITRLIEDLDFDEPKITSPSGPGNASYPCPCGKGHLIIKAVTGRENTTGDYVRYRTCRACGAKVKTAERVIREMQEGDNRKPGKGGRWK